MINDDKKHHSIGVVGLGNMGGALADALVAKGFDVTVWNRTPAKVERFAKAGVKVAASVTDLARAIDVLVVCLLDHAANLDAVLTSDVAAAMHGKTFIQMTLVDDQGLADLEVWAKSNDIVVLSGSIFVYPDDIRAGDGTVVYGGSRSVFDAVRPLLDAMGGHPMYAGEKLTSGRPIGRAYCCFLYPAVIGFLHGAAVCHRAGIPIEDFTRSVILPFIHGRALAGMLEGLTRATSRRRYIDDMQATLDVWNQSLKRAINGINELGVSTELMRVIEISLDRACDEGHGQHDLASVFETLIEQPR
jgi:3-hydroxyisobutyrate dehydrogenase-like beta-hydroxyacid dehydrogenase